MGRQGGRGTRGEGEGGTARRTIQLEVTLVGQVPEERVMRGVESCVLRSRHDAIVSQHGPGSRRRSLWSTLPPLQRLIRPRRVHALRPLPATPPPLLLFPPPLTAIICAPRKLSRVQSPAMEATCSVSTSPALHGAMEPAAPRRAHLHHQTGDPWPPSILLPPPPALWATVKGMHMSSQSDGALGLWPSPGQLLKPFPPTACTHGVMSHISLSLLDEIFHVADFLLHHSWPRGFFRA